MTAGAAVDTTTAISAVAEQARGAAITAGEAATAIADRTAIAAITGTGRACGGIKGESIAHQQPAVGTISGAVPDEGP